MKNINYLVPRNERITKEQLTPMHLTTFPTIFPVGAVITYNRFPAKNITVNKWFVLFMAFGFV